jgi:hypothetical protein
LTYFVRLLDAEAAAAAGEYETSSKAVPVAALRAFTPSLKDKGGLSVFAVPDVNSVTMVAAAIGLRKDSWSGKSIFLCLPAEDVTKLGVTPVMTDGNTGYLAVDAAHSEINVSDSAALLALTQAFLAGEIVSVEGKAAQKEIIRAARANEVDFAKLADPKDTHGSARHLLTWIKDGMTKVIGVPAPS